MKIYLDIKKEYIKHVEYKTIPYTDNPIPVVESIVSNCSVHVPSGRSPHVINVMNVHSIVVPFVVANVSKRLGRSRRLYVPRGDVKIILKHYQTYIKFYSLMPLCLIIA